MAKPPSKSQQGMAGAPPCPPAPTPCHQADQDAASLDPKLPFQLNIPKARPPKPFTLFHQLKSLEPGARAQVFREQMHQASQGLAQAKFWGEGTHPDDASFWFDFASFGAKNCFPSLPCWAGCAECCSNAPFRVSALEWQAVAKALDAMPVEKRQPLLHQAWSDFHPHQEDMESLAKAWTSGDPFYLPIALQRPCPMLSGPPEGRQGCSVYTARPAMCRAYGHAAAANAEGQVRPLICPQRGPQWLEAQVEDGVKDLPWPRWEPMWEAVVRLNGGPGSQLAPLAWWLLRDLKAGRWPDALPQSPPKA